MSREAVPSGMRMLKYWECTREEMEYNLEHTGQMGLIVFGSKPTQGDMQVLRLTPEGHKFLRVSEPQSELFTLRLPLLGFGSIDLKELWRRFRHWIKHPE
jgi:hypothetical protein